MSKPERESNFEAVGPADPAAARRYLHRHFAAILATLPHAVYWKGPDGRYGGCSPAFARHVGLDDPSQVMGKRDAALPWPRATGEDHDRLDQETLSTGRRILDQEETRYDTHGVRSVHLVSRVPLRNLHDGGIEGMLGILVDVTQVKELENQLGHASRLEAIGHLAAGIAHEINTPTQYVSDNTRFLQDAFGDVLGLLTRIRDLLHDHGAPNGPLAYVRSQVDTLMEQADLEFLSAEIPRAVAESLEGLDRVSTIVRAMKDFSHPGEGKVLTDINHLIESTITVARNEWKYVAEVVTALDPDLLPASVLAGPLKQVVLNMIVNAAHAIEAVVGDGSSGKGTITIASRDRDGQVEISITDTGCGIPEQIRGRVFDPFFTTKTVGKGTGQGLNIAHAVVVNKHGGEIVVESEVGRGTTFTILLPRIESEDAIGPHPSSDTNQERAA